MTSQFGVPVLRQPGMLQSSRVSAQLLEKVPVCCICYRKCESVLVLPHMTSMLTELVRPENTFELKAPWLIGPVCPRVQEKVD